MLITDPEVKHLKPWLIQKLEAISEADSQILSDYVLALLQAESSQGELRVNAVENLNDFLGNKTVRFVDEVFQALNTKAYIPGKIVTGTLPPSRIQPFQNTFSRSSTIQPNVVPGTASAGQKRSFTESNGTYVDHDSPARKQYDRNPKQSQGNDGQGRRPRARENRAGHSNRKQNNGTATFAGNIPTTMTDLRQNNLRGFQNQYHTPALQPPDMHNPNTLAFDPNAALQAVMTLQAMGFPFPLPIPSPAIVAGEMNARSRLNKVCRDYNSQGFCRRGDKCQFTHDISRAVGTGANATETLARSGSIGATYEHIPSSNGNSFDRGIARTNETRAVFSSSAIHGNQENFIGIVVEAIPEDYFDHSKIREYFSSFGAIRNIVLRAYHHLAIIEYEDHISARMAVESPKVVFDDRSVKVYWYIPALDDKRANEIIVAQPDTKLEEPEVDWKQFEIDNEAAQKRYQARQALIRATQQKRLELVALQKELDFRKTQEIQKMKDMLAANGKILSSDKDITTNNTKKDEETISLLAQLKALEDEAQSLGLAAESESGYRPGYSYRGRGGIPSQRGYPARGRGRGGYGRGGYLGNGGYNLDNRPRRIKAESAVEFDDAMDECLKRFLFTLGEYVSVEPDTGGRTKVIDFVDRLTAQTFYYSGKDIPGVGSLVLSWEPNLPVAHVRIQALDVKKDVSDYSSTFESIKQEDREDGEILPDRNDERDYEMNDSDEDYEWIT